jgi:hypothetical protein
MSRLWATCGSLLVAGFMTANAQAMQGCGAASHLNAYGRCVPNRAAVVVAPAAGAVVAAPVAGAVVAAPVASVVARKRCPMGYRMNANGVCRHI